MNASEHRTRRWLDRSGVLRRVLPAALLVAVNPLAAILPLIGRK